MTYKFGPHPMKTGWFLDTVGDFFFMLKLSFKLGFRRELVKSLISIKSKVTMLQCKTYLK